MALPWWDFWEPSGGQCNRIPASSRAFSSLLLLLFDSPGTHEWFFYIKKKKISWPEHSVFQEGSPMVRGSGKLSGGPACGQSALSPPGSHPL